MENNLFQSGGCKKALSLGGVGSGSAFAYFAFQSHVDIYIFHPAAGKHYFDDGNMRDGNLISLISSYFIHAPFQPSDFIFHSRQRFFSHINFNLKLFIATISLTLCYYVQQRTHIDCIHKFDRNAVNFSIACIQCSIMYRSAKDNCCRNRFFLRTQKKGEKG